MSRAESAEGLYKQLGRAGLTCWGSVRIIEARDNAVANAAELRGKLAALHEIAVLVGEMQCCEGHEYEAAHQRAVEMVTAKYSQTGGESSDG